MFDKSEILRSLREVQMQYNAWLSTSFRDQERRRWRNFPNCKISPKLTNLATCTVHDPNTNCVTCTMLR